MLCEGKGSLGEGFFDYSAGVPRDGVEKTSFGMKHCLRELPCTPDMPSLSNAVAYALTYAVAYALAYAVADAVAYALTYAMHSPMHSPMHSTMHSALARSTLVHILGHSEMEKAGFGEAW